MLRGGGAAAFPLHLHIKPSISSLIANGKAQLYGTIIMLISNKVGVARRSLLAAALWAVVLALQNYEYKIEKVSIIHVQVAAESRAAGQPGSRCQLVACG